MAMNLIDHLSIQCADVVASAAFYDAVLSPLGGARVMDFGEVVGYGAPSRPEFWIGKRSTGDGFRESHIAFAAPDRPGCGSSTRRRWHKERRCSTSLVSGPNTTATISAPLCETPMATTSRPFATCRSEPGQRSGPGFLASHPNPA